MDKQKAIEKLNNCFTNIVIIRKQVNNLVDNEIIISDIADMED